MAKKNQEENSQQQKVSGEKLKALQLTLDKLEKTYGKGTIMNTSSVAGLLLGQR